MNSFKKTALAFTAFGFLGLASQPWLDEGPERGSGLIGQAWATDGSAPLADAGLDRTLDVGASVVLDGSRSRDPQTGNSMSFSWVLVSKPTDSAAALAGATAVKPSLVLDAEGDYAIDLTVTRDSDGHLSLTDRVVISTENSAPVADAGDDREAPQGETVTLEGTASFDMDGDALTYAWSLLQAPAGSAAALGSPAAPRTTLTLDQAGTYVAELTVTDSAGKVSAADQVTLSTDELTAHPTVERSLAASVGETLVLRPDAFGQLINDSNHTSQKWTLLKSPVGSVAAIADHRAVRPSLTVDQPGTYVVQLEVTGEGGDKRAGTATIDTENLPPQADAGPDQLGIAMEKVILDAAASTDLEGDLVSYRWSLIKKPMNSTAGLADADELRSSFIADKEGTYVAQLIVTDGSGEAGAPDTVVVDTGNVRPVADAGADQVTQKRSTVYLAGGDSRDANSDGLTYLWTVLEAPNGNGGELNDPTSEAPSFYAHKDGDYLLQLVVSDGSLESEPDTILVTTGNRRPVADPGDGAVLAGLQPVNLDGILSSDANGDNLIFDWSIIHKPAGSTAVLSDPTAVAPSFTMDVVGDYVAQLVVYDGIEYSLPKTVVFSVVNQVPVAVAMAIPDSIATGQAVSLNGTDSFDPDGDPLFFDWSLLAAPDGSTVGIVSPSSAIASFTPDLEGDYSFRLIVNDGNLFSAPDEVTISAFIPSLPPELELIGDRTVALGTTLTLQLLADDPNGDVLSFTANPLPLPDGAGLDSQSGQFTFRPTPSQVGSFPITFIVSDGVLTDEETITITVPAPDATGITIVSGRLLDTNSAVDGTEIPIIGAKVSVLESGISAFSDGNGNFSLAGISDGDAVLDIDSTSADLAPDGSTYAGFREFVMVIANVDNQIERPIYLPRIDGATLTTIDPATTTTVYSAALGVTLEIAPNSATFEDGTPVTLGDDVQISISEVPENLAPAALPEGHEPNLLITLQPVGISFDPPAAITFPNLDNLLPGNEVDIYSLDPSLGQFGVSGIGLVNASGTEINTISGGIRATDWHDNQGPDPDPDGDGDGSGSGTGNGAGDNNSGQKDDQDKCVECEGNSAIALHSGNLAEAHELVSYQSYGQVRAPRMVYNSTAADPQIIISANTTVPFRSAVPLKMSARLVVAGLNQGTEVFTDTSVLNENINETIRQVVQFDATSFATGSYFYRFIAKNYFERSRIAGESGGVVLVNNEINSPFGAGWTLDGLHRLHIQDRDVILTQGDNSVTRFEPEIGYEPPVNFGSFTTPMALATGDFDSDGDLDVAVPDATTSLVQVFLGDGSGGLTLSDQLQIGATSAVGFGLISVATGDFNGDGNLDIIGINPTSRRVGMAYGNGDGTFGAVFFVDLNSGNGVTIAVADFDLDGHDDFAYMRGSGFRVRYGAGDGTFSRTVSRAADFDIKTMHLADVDNDGNSDIMSVSARSDKLRITENPQVGGGLWGSYGIGAGAMDVYIGQWGVASGDFNSDGRVDAVVVNRPTDRVTVRAGQGDGRFGSAVATLITDDAPHSVAVDDMNGDGIDDIVVSHQNSGNILIFAGDGNLGFQRLTSIPVSGVVGAIRLGDFNGDGLTDIVASNRSDRTVALILQGFAGATVFNSPAGDFSTLAKNADGSFTRTMKDGIKFEFYADGLQRAEVDRNNNATTYTYDALDRLETISDPADLVTTFFYDDDLDEQLDRVVDPAGRETLFDHDAAGDLISITDPDLSFREFAYDARHRLTSQNSKRGFTTSYDYGFHGRAIRANRPDLTTNEFVASKVFGLADLASGIGTEINPAPVVRPEDRFASTTDGNGVVTTYQLDRFGLPLRVEGVLSQTASFERDQNGDLDSSTDPNGRVTFFTYDNARNVLSREQIVGDPLQDRVFRFEYEPLFNQLMSVSDANGNPPTEYSYDFQGNLTAIRDPLNRETTFQYGDVSCRGNVTSITKAAGTVDESTSSFAYIPSTCNLLEAIDPVGSPETRAYDAAGNVIQITDSLGRISRFEYNNMNQITKATEPVNMDPSPICGTTGVTCITYDAAGNVREVSGANGSSNTFDYDNLDRIIAETDFFGNSKSAQYDGNGNLTLLTDRKGQVIEYRYDEENRLVVQIMQPGTTEESTRLFNYDAQNNLLSIVDPNSALTYTYDAHNRLKSVSTTGSPNQPDTLVEYEYDKNDNRVSMQDNVGITTYSYDTVNRMTEIVDPTNQATAQSIFLNYDSLDRKTGVTRPGGATTTQSFDAASRIVSIANMFSTSNISSFNYVYGSTINRQSVDQQRGAVSVVPTQSYIYDELDRVVQITDPFVATESESFVYDALGNLLLQNNQVLDSSFDAASRLLEGPDFLYTYDANGNLETKVAKADSSVTIFRYDAEDRLTQIENPDGSAIEYRYDGLGRRITKAFQGVTKQYIYDQEDILLEYNAQDVLLARYTHGPGIDDPLVMERDLDGDNVFSSIERFDYHRDALGSVTEITDNNGSIVMAYVYSAYGKVLSQVGSLENPYAFTGREYDAESGLYFLRARYYDATTGRFTQEDPTGLVNGDLNLYRYTANNPINFSDPSGEVLIGCLAGLGGGLGAEAIAQAQSGEFNACRLGVGAAVGGITGCIGGTAVAKAVGAVVSGFGKKVVKSVVKGSKTAAGASAFGGGFLGSIVSGLIDPGSLKDYCPPEDDFCPRKGSTGNPRGPGATNRITVPGIDI